MAGEAEERVRALHIGSTHPLVGGDERFCQGCGLQSVAPSLVEWPCDTIRALDESKQEKERDGLKALVERLRETFRGVRARASAILRFQ